MEKIDVNKVSIKLNGNENSNNKLKAYASVFLNNFLRISGIKVIDGSNGLFISYPAFKRADGKFQELVFPFGKEERRYIQEQVLNSFHSEMIKKAA